MRQSKNLVTVKRVCVLAILLTIAMGTVHALASDPALAPAYDPPAYSNPVMPGDFPDPTAMRIGPEYWAIATRGAGQPSPPILRSPDLVHWTLAGHIFTQPPA